MIASSRPPFAAIVKDSLIAGAISIIIFGPICGIILEGYAFSTNFKLPLTLTAIVIAGRFLLSWFGLPGFPDISRLHPLANRTPVGLQRTVMAVLFIALLIFPFLASKYWVTVMILALIYVLLGLGLNIVVGLAGLLDLGFVAFYAVGAYGYALGYQYLGLGFWGAIPFSALMAATFGAILGFPVLRMHGDYLAIVTLGFGEIIRIVLNNWLEFTGGPNGVSAPLPTLFGLEFSRRARQGGIPIHEYLGIGYSNALKYIFIYLVLLLFVVVIIAAVSRLKKMPLGRAWEALREDEIACRSLGLNHVTTKLSAFSMGAMIGGIGGVFFAAYQGFVNPSSFTFFESALILAVVVLGGLGSTVGVVLAAVILTILPEALRDFSTYRVLIFGILMVLMMIWRPRGLIKVKRPVFLQRVEGK